MKTVTIRPTYVHKLSADTIDTTEDLVVPEPVWDLIDAMQKQVLRRSVVGVLASTARCMNGNPAIVKRLYQKRRVEQALYDAIWNKLVATKVFAQEQHYNRFIHCKWELVL